MDTKSHIYCIIGSISELHLRNTPCAITIVFTHPIYQNYFIDEYHLKVMVHIFTLNDVGVRLIQLCH